MSEETKPQRALITYRIRELEDGAKLSGDFQRVIENATGSVIVSRVSWPDQD